MRNAIVIVALAGLAGLTSADTVANWNFNDQGLPAGGFGFQTSDFPQNADVGTGLFTIGNFNGDNTAGVYNWVQSFAGTTTAAIGGASSGGSFAFQGAANQGVTNNGAQATFSFNGASYTSLMFDFARRGTGTGFNNVTIELFDAGSSLGVIDTLGGATSTWIASNYDISALDGVADASIVFTFDGASSDTGNNRLDNVTIPGIIPAPGAAALLGLGGLVGSRRRR